MPAIGFIIDMIIKNVSLIEYYKDWKTIFISSVEIESFLFIEINY